MKQSLKILETKIKYKFSNIELLKQSLTHKSFNTRTNNEKLEFLGDRVLGLIISKKLIENYPNDKEGIIDKKFANLVNKNKCVTIAAKINLKKFMLLGSSYKGLKRSDDKIIGDCLEALIGAIFLDSRFKDAEKVVLSLWKELLEKSDITPVDAKTKLQEYTLKKYKILPEYISYKQSGPQHSPIFKVDVRIPNSKKYSAEGKSKKNAEQNAAKNLIKDLNIK